jgi:hypothetical protein
MKAISIRQPWVWAIFHGGKNLENRVWSTTHRGPVLILASKQFDQVDIQAVREIFRSSGRDPDLVSYPSAFKEMHLNDPRHPYPTGGIVGVADLVDVVWGEDVENPWYAGSYQWSESRQKDVKNYGFILANARRVPFRSMNGALGLFDVPDKIAREVIEA